MGDKRSLQDVLGPMRVPFLALTPMCVLVGLGTAWWSGGGVDFGAFAAALAGALAAHVSVNAFNEYFDFKTGLDYRTRRTPFSGGSGTLPGKPHLAGVALTTGVLSALVVLALGCWFIHLRGWGILPLGLLGMAVVMAYTPWLTHHPGVCLVAPGLGFGPLMVMGTHFVLTGRYEWTSFWASLVPFFLVNDLLLLNQFPDVEADRTVGRRHFPMVLGRRKSAHIYAVFLALAYLSLITGVVLGALPKPALLGCLTAIAAVPLAREICRHAESIDRLLPSMKRNVQLTLLTPLLLAAGLIAAALFRG